MNFLKYLLVLLQLCQSFKFYNNNNKLTKKYIFTRPDIPFDEYYVDKELYIFYDNKQNAYQNIYHQKKKYDETNYMYDLIKISQTVIYKDNKFINDKYESLYKNIIENKIIEDKNDWLNIKSIVKIKDVY